MGDRVHTTITFHGHVASLAAFQELVQAIENKGFHDNRYEHQTSSTADIEATFVRDIREGIDPTFCDEQCNYANVEEMTDVCEEHGISWFAEWEAGGGFEAGHSGYVHGVGPFDGDNATLDCTELEKILAGPDPLTVLKAKAAEMKFAAGADMPDFTVCDEVRDHLAVEAAKQAVAA